MCSSQHSRKQKDKSAITGITIEEMMMLRIGGRARGAPNFFMNEDMQNDKEWKEGVCT
jgi:hypothetical protein